MVINCWDKDQGLFDSTDDYMGSAVIDMDEKAPWIYTQMKTFKKQLNQAPIPVWHDFKNGLDPKGNGCGKLLVSFSIVKNEYKWEMPCKLMQLLKMVKCKDYKFDLTVLGLR